MVVMQGTRSCELILAAMTVIMETSAIATTMLMVASEKVVVN